MNREEAIIDVNLLVAENRELKEDIKTLKGIIGEQKVEKTELKEEVKRLKYMLDDEVNHSSNLIEEVKRLNELINSSPKMYTENMVNEEKEKKLRELNRDLERDNSKFAIEIDRLGIENRKLKTALISVRCITEIIE